MSDKDKFDGAFLAVLICKVSELYKEESRGRKLSNEEWGRFKINVSDSLRKLSPMLVFVPEVGPYLAKFSVSEVEDGVGMEVCFEPIGRG